MYVVRVALVEQKKIFRRLLSTFTEFCGRRQHLSDADAQADRIIRQFAAPREQ